MSCQSRWWPPRPCYLTRFHLMISAGGATGPAGILAVNISNRFLDLEPLVDGQCRALGKTDRRVDNDDDDSEDMFAAFWVLATSPANGFDKLIMDGSTEIRSGRNIRLWTDDYSNLFQILR